jgi:hypothetical protein
VLLVACFISGIAVENSSAVVIVNAALRDSNFQKEKFKKKNSSPQQLSEVKNDDFICCNVFVEPVAAIVFELLIE